MPHHTISEMPQFSIIVPIYNVENYLERCIGSLLCQSYRDFEILLIDDGSPDSSGDICDRYAKEDCRVKVIHKTNGGLSSARNAGLDMARGKYVMFVDSDDYLNTPDALQAINERIKQRSEDIILFGCKNENASTGISYISRGGYDTGIIDLGDKSTTLLHLYDTNNFPGSAWIMTVRRQLIEDIHLRFVIGETGEDYYWNENLLYHAESIGAVDLPLYTYVIGRPNSITSGSSVSGIRGMMHAVSDWRSKPDREGFTGITRFLARTYAISLMAWSNLDKKGKKEALPLLQANKAILKEANMAIYIILYHIISLLGPAIPAKLTGWLYSIVSRR